MRRLIAWNLVTLDGYFNGASPWELDWHQYAWGEELEQFSLEQGRTAAALLFGRVTYEGMAAYWTSAEAAAEGETADLMNAIPKVVVSTTLVEATWHNTTLVGEDPEPAVRRMKAEDGPGDLFIFGSAHLTHSLRQRGLIDEYRLGLVPVVLGGGEPLFKPAPRRERMELVDTRPLRTGCVILTYRPMPE